MRMPFEHLMEQVAGLSDEDAALTLGVLSERWGEPSSRIGDAIDAVRVLKGQRTYISLGPDLRLPVTVDDRIQPGTAALTGRDPDGNLQVAVLKNLGPAKRRSWLSRLTRKTSSPRCQS